MRFQGNGGFRSLRRAIQGAALKIRKLLKKFDQNFVPWKLRPILHYGGTKNV